MISVDEFKKFRDDVRESAEKDTSKIETEDLAPGEDEPDDHVRDEEETAAIKDKILSARRKIHKQNVAAVTARWTFEEGIKRPYFHVKPLERCQLKNWKEYLDFEIEQGDRNRILVLFERCLIACALYDEFWLKLIRYLESQNDADLIEKTRDVYFRACTVHHTDKPALHMLWASFEECQHDLIKAQEILTNLDTVCPNLLQVAYKRINIERRKGDYSKCAELYEHYINNAKNKNIAGTLTIKYARFCNKIKADLDGGIAILKAAFDKDPANTRLALQMIDLLLQRPVVNETEVVAIMDTFMERDGIEPDQKVLFAQRKVEFLEDFGSTAKGMLEAQRELQTALNKANETKKKKLVCFLSWDVVLYIQLIFFFLPTLCLTVMLQLPKNQQKKLHSQRPVHQHIMATMDRAIIPVITMPASMVHSHIAIAMAIINGNSTDRDMVMHIAMHGVVIAAVAITKHISVHTTVVTFFYYVFFLEAV